MTWKSVCWFFCQLCSRKFSSLLCGSHTEQLASDLSSAKKEVEEAAEAVEAAKQEHEALKAKLQQVKVRLPVHSDVSDVLSIHELN